eukprot:636979-Hanusia_phi.AAC.1
MSMLILSRYHDPPDISLCHLSLVDPSTRPRQQPSRSPSVPGPFLAKLYVHNHSEREQASIE